MDNGKWINDNCGIRFADDTSIVHFLFRKGVGAIRR